MMNAMFVLISEFERMSVIQRKIDKKRTERYIIILKIVDDPSVQLNIVKREKIVGHTLFRSKLSNIWLTISLFFICLMTRAALSW